MPEDWLKRASGAVAAVFPELAPHIKAYRAEKCSSCGARWASAVWPRMLDLAKGRDTSRLKGLIPDDLYIKLGR